MKLSTKHKINQRHFKISSTNNCSLNMIPESLLGIRVCPRERFHKLDGMVNSFMSETCCCKSIVSGPFIRMNYRTRKDPPPPPPPPPSSDLNLSATTETLLDSLETNPDPLNLLDPPPAPPLPPSSPPLPPSSTPLHPPPSPSSLQPQRKRRNTPAEEIHTLFARNVSTLYQPKSNIKRIK